MTEPLVSVIIPVYNVAEYLREAIESVINQTYENLEIIIIDDGSEDGSQIICDEYSYDERVKVIHQENHGLSAARNAGLKIMTGDLIAFLDSDDVYYHNMLSRLVEEMVNKEADIVICDFKWDTRTSGLERKSCNKVEALKDLINDKMEKAVWNKLYKRSIWDGISFPEGHNYEGTRITYKLIERANIIEIIPDCLMLHRTRPGSIVQTPSKENLYDFLLACQEYEEYVKEQSHLILSRKEYTMFLERRFGLKLKYWITAKGTDASLAKYLREEILKQTPAPDSWSMRAKMKYYLFRWCPGGLYVYKNRNL